jgi:UDP-GlcNAc:undecaprenyl-phosphate GlcNAc-1-phosphate transferase
MLVASAVAFVVALVSSLVATPLVRDAAERRDLLDEPGGRKIHARAVPRLGGAAMLLAFFLAVAVGVAADSATGGGHLLAMLAGIGIVSAVGLVDDLRDLPPLVKLAGQLAAAIVTVVLGLSLSELAWFGGTVQLGWAGPIITVVWLVAVANAVNLIDGLDGLAGGVSLATLLAFATIALMREQAPVLLCALAAAGAVIAFLAHNRPPASIIMGDAGSMFLGMLLGTSSVALVAADPGRITPLLVIIALAVPLADMTWAVVRRLASRKSIFAADSNHIHHQLMARGLGQGQVTLLLVAASAVLGLVAVLLAR